MKRVGVLFLTGYMVSASVAHAATYYVSKSGNNSNSCATAQNITTPKATLTGATGGLQCLFPGDTLFVRAGTYPERILNGIRGGTSWANAPRIAAYSGETVWLTPTAGTDAAIRLDAANTQYIEFDGINVDSRAITGQGQLSVIAFTTQLKNDVHHIRFKNAEVSAGASGGTIFRLGSHQAINATGGHHIQNVTVHGGGVTGTCGIDCSGYAIYVSGPNHIIENCDIYDTSARGIDLYTTGDPTTNVTIRNNRIHDITRTGVAGQYVGVLFAANANNNYIYNNLIYNIGVGGQGVGIWAGAYSSPNGNKIWNNTIYNSKEDGIRIESSATNTEVRNNIAYLNTGANYVNGSGTTQVSNNLFGVDPLFVNPSARDFQLKDTSPAVDTGNSLSVVTSDFAGVPRPQGTRHDIGAYEFRGQATGPPAPPTGVRIVSN